MTGLGDLLGGDRTPAPPRRRQVAARQRAALAEDLVVDIDARMVATGMALLPDLSNGVRC
jgi:hypothetical protein